jgi:hypothetical protein
MKGNAASRNVTDECATFSTSVGDVPATSVMMRWWMSSGTTFKLTAWPVMPSDKVEGVAFATQVSRVNMVSVI